jgi:hypothetical protein
VAVPGHDAAWLNSELAEAKLALFDVGGFFFKIDSSEHGVGYTFTRVGDRLTRIGFHLVGGTTTGNRG